MRDWISASVSAAPACRKAWGDCCSTPSVAPSARSNVAVASDRVRFRSVAISNSTASAPGVLKSSFIAVRNAAARGSAQSMALASTGCSAPPPALSTGSATVPSAVYRRRSAERASSRLTSLKLNGLR